MNFKKLTTIFMPQYKDNSLYSLRELKIHKPEGIECKYFQPDLKTEEVDVLILSVIGTYPSGSLGNAHGQYISMMALQGVQVFFPAALIFDLRELEYHWGNTLLGIFQDVSTFMNTDNVEKQPFFPIFAVTSNKSKAGFLSLVTPINGEKPSWHFDELDSAIEKAIIDGKVWWDF